MAVLVQESPGHPFPRARTAYALSPCVLLSLSWTDMQQLRRGSVSIDLAVREAVQVRTIPFWCHSLMKTDDSLRQAGDQCEEPGLPDQI
jgi:hypothetical protein